MIQNEELRNQIDKISKELFPNIPLDFRANKLCMNIFCGEIRMACPLCIDRSEIIHDGILNELKLKRLLVIWMDLALTNLKNHAQKELDKLEKL